MSEKYYDTFCKGLVDSLVQAKHYMENRELKLWRYYDRHTGRFIVPVSIAESQTGISEEIVELLRMGYCLSTFIGEVGTCYCICNLATDTQGATLIKEKREWAKSLCENRGIKYFSKIKLSVYGKNPIVMGVADDLVFDNNGEYSLAWVVSEDYLVLIEVKELCW